MAYFRGTFRGTLFLYDYGGSWKSPDSLVSVEVQNKPPQNVPHWHVDYFELKTNEAQSAQGELSLTAPPVPLTLQMYLNKGLGT